MVVSVTCIADIIYCQLVTSAKPCQFWAANPNVFRYSLQPDWHTDKANHSTYASASSQVGHGVPRTRISVLSHRGT